MKTLTDTIEMARYDVYFHIMYVNFNTLNRSVDFRVGKLPKDGMFFLSSCDIMPFNVLRMTSETYASYLVRTRQPTVNSFTWPILKILHNRFFEF